MNVERVVLALSLSLWALLPRPPARAKGAAAPGPAPPSGVTAFVHASVVPMDREAVLADHTVLVEGDRIVAVGPSASVPVPENARVVPAEGKFLLPGLVDAHMHLDSFTGARRDFGDGLVFLAYGVTTVFNLRGQPEHLAWKKRVEAGELVGPQLFNSGEFVNEPRPQPGRAARPRGEGGHGQPRPAPRLP